METRRFQEWKYRHFCNYLKYPDSGYWIWIRSSARASVIHSFGKTVSAAWMGLVSKQETKITKGKWKKCFVLGWNEGQHQMRIKKRALQHPRSAMLSPQYRQDWQMITSELTTEVFAEEKNHPFIWHLKSSREEGDFTQTVTYSWKANMPGMQSDEDGFAETLSKISSFFSKRKRKTEWEWKAFSQTQSHLAFLFISREVVKGMRSIH